MLDAFGANKIANKAIDRSREKGLQLLDELEQHIYKNAEKGNFICRFPTTNCCPDIVDFAIAELRRIDYVVRREQNYIIISWEETNYGRR